MKAAIGWFAFPILALFALVAFAGIATGVLDRSHYFLNVLTTIFYLGALLFTVPINIFTVIALVVSYRHWKSGRPGWKTSAIAGVANFIISLLWIGSIILNEWYMTA